MNELMQWFKLIPGTHLSSVIVMVTGFVMLIYYVATAVGTMKHMQRRLEADGDTAFVTKLDLQLAMASLHEALGKNFVSKRECEILHEATRDVVDSLQKFVQLRPAK